MAQGGKPVEIMGMMLGRPDTETPNALIVTDVSMFCWFCLRAVVRASLPGMFLADYQVLRHRSEHVLFVFVACYRKSQSTRHVFGRLRCVADVSMFCSFFLRAIGRASLVGMFLMVYQVLLQWYS